MVLKISSVTLSLILTFLATCIFGWLCVPWFIKWQVSEKFVLSPEYNGELYSEWIQPSLPIYFKVYLFNVTNPLDVEQGELPILNEVGPYVFLEKRKKIDLVTDEDKDTITYKEHVTYYFQSELSKNLTLEDKMTIINAPFVASATKISHDIPWPMNELAKVILLEKGNLEPVFVEKSVHELLFDGWNVPFCYARI